ncbi:thiosulfate oxidation carrier complex protein SoxZ [Rubellimicrobium roseum]|uniref:Thiosulfate oxidation carrier complex protein SoxZ n=1 Tax=Rubellimicrobium roseum TaxID=687525 RepID=A0A5C4NFX6_9RHOB|nr:thiosulfate oxidation carrier complex protein SoxZ [Rubellimicrobium roseum]TNC71339.1 thiosulfate oxidation carrier complex protein SoxZ [Rubellimicrobium roseum]
MVAMVNIPETAAPGDIVEVKILISHPMETGFRTGADGNLVPRDIIHELRCLYAGEEVFRAEIFPAIAANPFLGFFLRATETAEVELLWTDEAGQEHSERRTLTVG